MDNVFIRKEISFFGVVRKKNIMLQPESSNVIYPRGDITDQLWTGSGTGTGSEVTGNKCQYLYIDHID